MDRRPRRSSFVPGSEDLEGRNLLSTVPTAVAAPAAQVASKMTASQQQAATIAQEAADAAQQAADAAQQSQAQSQTQTKPLTPAQQKALANAAAIRQKNYQDAYAARLTTISKLPGALRLVDSQQPIPDVAVKSLQQDLSDLIGQLRIVTGSPASDQYVKTLRDVIPAASVHVASVAELNHSFSLVLQVAGAKQETIDHMIGSLNELAQSAVYASQPVVALTNDYTIVLQAALGVGRPLPKL